MEPPATSTAESTSSAPPPASPPGIPTLHHLSSSQSLRILWALEELSAAQPSFTYNLKKYERIKARAPPELQAIHPLGLSPVLVVPPAASSPEASPTVVTESRLILQYLADHYSASIWTPTSATDRTRDAFFQEFANASLGPKMASVLQFDMIPAHVPFLLRPLANLIFGGLAGIFRKDLEKMFRLMEDALAGEVEGEGEAKGKREWFAGERIGLADFCVSWPMDLAEQRGYFDGKAWPKIAAWLDRVHGRKAYMEARAKGGSYDLVSFDWK